MTVPVNVGAPVTTTTKTTVVIIPGDATNANGGLAGVLANIFAPQQPAPVAVFNPATALQAMDPTALTNMPSILDLAGLTPTTMNAPNNNIFGLGAHLLNRLAQKITKNADADEKTLLKKVLPELIGLATLDNPLGAIALAKDAAAIQGDKGINVINPISVNALMATAPAAYTTALVKGSNNVLDGITKRLVDDEGKLKKLSANQQAKLDAKLELEKAKLETLEQISEGITDPDLKEAFDDQLKALRKSIKETEHKLHPGDHAENVEKRINKNLDEKLGEDKDGFDAKVTDEASWDKAKADLDAEKARLDKLKAFAETLADDHPDKEGVDETVSSLEARISDIQTWLDDSPHKH